MKATTPTGTYEIAPLYTFTRTDGLTDNCLLADDDAARAIANEQGTTASVVNEMTGTTVWTAEEGKAI